MFSRFAKKVDFSVRGSVFQNILILVLGASSAKLLGFAAIPIITRLYSPEDLGLLAIFASLVSMLLPLTTLRYVIAIPLPRRDEMAINILVLCLGVSSAVTFLALSLFWIFGSEIFGFFSAEKIAPLWPLLIVGLYAETAFEALTMWATRKKAFREIARTHIAQSFAGAVTKIGLGLLSATPGGLIAGQVVQQSGGVVFLLGRFRTAFSLISSEVTFKRLRHVFYYYREIPIYRLPSQMVLILSSQIPLLFAALVYDIQDVGQISLAFMAIMTPVNLLAQTAGTAFFGEVSRVGRTNPARILKITIGVTMRMLIISVLPVLILLIFGPDLFELAFGGEWRIAGQYAQLLSIYLFAQLVTQPTMNVLTIFNKHSIFLRINLYRAAITTIIIFVCYGMELPADQFILIFSITMALFFSLTWLKFVSILRTYL
tara:strand:- start:1065 stop:2354 length:1290 start_codon:yes stop_codon:yes gene_type:complete